MWHHGKLHHKILFYLHPFLQDLVYIWSDVWSENLLAAAPLPAIVKLSLSGLILCIMLLPVVYWAFGLAMYVAFLQYQIESLYPGFFPENLKVYGWFRELFQNYNHSEESAKQWNKHFQQCLLFVVGTIDYFRVLMELI